MALVGVAVWLTACRLPAFAATIELRALIGAGIVTTYTWLTAFEFWRGRDEALVSRWPAIFILFAHGALFLLHPPLGAGMHAPGDSGLVRVGWLELLSLEGAAVHDLDRLHPAGHGQGAHRISPPHRRAHRFAHRHRQPSRLPRTDRGAQARGGGYRADRTAAVRPRSFQGGQRPLWPRHRRPRACRFSPTPPRPMSAPRDWWAAGAATSSSPCSTTPPATARRCLASGFSTHSRRPPPTSMAARSRRPSRTGMVFSAHGPFELSALLVQADQALYRAKRDGRNRLAVAAPETAAQREQAPASDRLAPVGRRTAA